MASNKQKKLQLNQLNQLNQPESFLIRLSKIPMIEFIFFINLSVYNKVKSSNRLFDNVLSKVESVIFTLFDKLRPLTNRFDNQVNYADSLGNRFLDKLETYLPSVVSFQPKNYYARTVNRMLSWRRYFSDRLNGVRNSE